MTSSQTLPCLLFDWGGTLMREFSEYDGPMVTWPRVEAMPHAAEALAALHGRWRLALATNAAASGEAQIRAALERVDLARYLDKIYCYRVIGHKKPSAEFFGFILNDLGIQPQSAVMVGDDFEADVLGANRAGIRAVWLNQKSDEARMGEMYRTIHDLGELPEALGRFSLPSGLC